MRLKTTGLFAGIGGVELGLEAAGHETIHLCEIDPSAGEVLRSRFPEAKSESDVTKVRRLPRETELVTAGFPCQDLSQAGNASGIRGARSGLVNEVFRLIEDREVPWVLLENVPFMLQLQRGTAMNLITSEFERLGYSWAYRVVDSRSFGLPQRRQRVFFLASKVAKPWELFFQTDFPREEPNDYCGKACGFYWTEGNRGLGWAVNAVPTLKGGSTIGIPSPPAIWLPDGRIVKPTIRDAERLQGFPPDWTLPAERISRKSARWKLVGNAVSVNAAKWVGECLKNEPAPLKFVPLPFDEKKSWPSAAFGDSAEGRFEVPVSKWPMNVECPPLTEFLLEDPELLSLKAVTGFLNRLTASSLRYPQEFLDALLEHQNAMKRNGRVAA